MKDEENRGVGMLRFADADAMLMYWESDKDELVVCSCT